jgi:hypothetical protein
MSLNSGLFNFTYQYTLTPDVDNPSKGHYLSVSVTQASGPDNFADTDILVFQQENEDPATGQYASFFTNVASPQDLYDITLRAEPNNDNAGPLRFRLSCFEGYFQSRAIAQRTLDLLLADIQLLSNALAQRYANVSPVSGTISTQ